MSRQPRPVIYRVTCCRCGARHDPEAASRCTICDHDFGGDCCAWERLVLTRQVTCCVCGMNHLGETNVQCITPSCQHAFDRRCIVEYVYVRDR